MAAQEDFLESVTALGNLGRIWDPFAIISTRGFDGRPLFATLLPKVIALGCGLLVVMLLLRLIDALTRQLADSDEDLGLLGIVTETVLVAVLILSYDPLVILLPHLFNMMGRSIAGLFAGDLSAQISGALQVLGNEKTTDFRFWTAQGVTMSAMGLLASTLSFVALVLMWVMGKLQGYLFTFWYLLGPLALPTLVFPPLRRVAGIWFSTLMGTAFMSIVGSLFFGILVRTSWLAKAFAAGSLSDFMSCLVYSLICIITLITIPFISVRLWSGIETNAVGAATGAKQAMGKATLASAWTSGKARQALSSVLPKPSLKPPAPRGT